MQPSDLNFNISIAGLTTFDGSTLSAPVTRSFTTPPQSISSVSVVSATALNLTDGAWDGQASYGSVMPTLAYKVEVPQDGVVTVSFAYPIDIAYLANALVLTNDATASNVPIALTPTQYYASTSVQFTASAPLAPGQSYTLKLRKGVQYHPLAGTPPVDYTNHDLGGLFPFAVPFLTSQALYGGLNANIWRAYLRHGLAPALAAQCNAAVSVIRRV
jgi:hypothetical protein